VIEIELPPLRDRKCDIPLLSNHFLKTFGRQYGKTHLRLSPEVEHLLLAYHYPGNIRELENIIQRAVVLVEEDSIQPRHLPPSLLPEGAASTRKGKLAAFRIAKQRAVQKFEREYIIDCLRITQGNVSRAAQTAGIDVKNFHVKMTKHGIDPHSFKQASLEREIPPHIKNHAEKPTEFRVGF
jgi:Nif-specific regulatory protein